MKIWNKIKNLYVYGMAVSTGYEDGPKNFNGGAWHKDGKFTKVKRSFCISPKKNLGRIGAKHKASKGVINYDKSVRRETFSRLHRQYFEDEGYIPTPLIARTESYVRFTPQRIGGLEDYGIDFKKDSWAQTGFRYTGRFLSF